MDEQDEDQKQFFRDLGASAEQTVQEVRGFEENYYSLIQATMAALPELGDFSKKMQSYMEQQFAAAYEFSRELSQAKDMQDFIRIHTGYIQKSLQTVAAQMADFAQAYFNVALGSIKAPSRLK
jgi:DNA repair ATPase RecN